MAGSDANPVRWRPGVVEVRAEYGGTFLWTVLDEGPVGLGPEVLHLSSDLADRLAAWNAEWEVEGEDDHEHDLEDWVARGRELARELQEEVPDVRVLYRYASGA